MDWPAKLPESTPLARDFPRPIRAPVAIPVRMGASGHYELLDPSDGRQRDPVLYAFIDAEIVESLTPPSGKR